MTDSSSSPRGPIPALGLSRIGQIAIPVKDLARSVEFYRDVLGLRFLFEAPPALAFFDCGGVRVMLEGSGEGSTASSTLYYVVADLQAAVDALRRRGAKVEADPHLIARMPDHDLWMAFIRDPDEHLLGLMSEVRPPAPRA